MQAQCSVLMMKSLCFLVFIAAVSLCNSQVLPFLELSGNVGIFSGVDDGSRQLTFPQPFYINGTAYTTAFISSNGLLSFGGSYTAYVPQSFPLSMLTVISPYWDDIDLRTIGNIFYESVTNSSTLTMISEYITDSQSDGGQFACTLAVVVEWSEVCPYGNQNCGMTNTFQVVLAASDQNTSYAIFTYKCGLLNWVKHHASIGFSAGQDFYANHNLSRTSDVNDIACLNQPTSQWNNVVYRVNEGTQDIGDDNDDHEEDDMNASGECTAECNLLSSELSYDCCHPDNFGKILRVMESSIVSRYLICPNHAPDWC